MTDRPPLQRHIDNNYITIKKNGGKASTPGGGEGPPDPSSTIHNHHDS